MNDGVKPEHEFYNSKIPNEVHNTNVTIIYNK